MELIEDFQRWLFEDGKSPKTIESYCGDVKLFQLYLVEKTADEQQPLSRFLFVLYKQYLLDEEFKVSTINKKVNSLKVFNDYLQLKGIVDGNYIQLRRDRVSIATGSEQVVNALTRGRSGKGALFCPRHSESQRKESLNYLSATLHRCTCF